MTKTQKFYLHRVIARIICFIVMSVLIWIEILTPHKGLNLKKVLNGLGFFEDASPLHLVWFFMIIYMVCNLFYTNLRHPGSAKQFKRFYLPVEYQSEEFKKTKKFYNKGALIVALSFLSLNLVFLGLYLLVKYLNIPRLYEYRSLLLLNLQLFYFMSDFICVMFWCPFQSFFMKNRCCRTCRIFNWGPIMIQVPMMILLIVEGFSFYALSLVILGVVVFIRWEIVHFIHPEYFYQISNNDLSCAQCKDKFCQIKRKVHSKYRDKENIL